MTETRADDLPDTPWISAALCRDMPLSLFLTGSDGTQTAKAACAHCPVLTECLSWAVINEVDEDLWGGRTARERRRLGIAYVQTGRPEATPPAAPVPQPATTRPQPTAQKPKNASKPKGTAQLVPRAKVVAQQPTQAVEPKSPPPPRTAPTPRRQPSPDALAMVPGPRSAGSAKCGTESGYKAHQRRKETTCQRCRDAMTQARVDRAARRAAGLPILKHAKVAACGTPAGYSRHLDRKEKPCDPCQDAARTYQRNRRAAAREAARIAALQTAETASTDESDTDLVDHQDRGAA